MSARDGADAPYWEGLEQGKLMLPRCAGCDRWTWPAGHRCGTCGALGTYWVERAIRATVFAWTRTWHRFAMTEALEMPFVSMVVEVDDCGIRLMGRFEDLRPDDPRIGEPLVGRLSETVVGERRIAAIIWSRAA